MVCFIIQFLVPLQERLRNNGAVESRIKHLTRHSNGDISATLEEDGMRLYEIRVCDEDAVSLLRDFPTPFAVIKIDILHPNANLYRNSRHHVPPHIRLLQDVYWLAKSTERYKLSIPNELYQTK